MNLSRYLGLMGRLYKEGVVSNFHPNLLRRIGGTLKLAAVDAPNVRVETDAFFWFDVTRNPSEMWAAADRSWAQHRRGLQQLMQAGSSPSRAIHNYMVRHGTFPHTPNQLQQMLQQQMDNHGNHSAWMGPTIAMRRRISRGANVMTDTFGALGTIVALAVTAENWTSATPAEWDRAMNTGEVVQAMGQVAGAAADGRSQFMDSHRTASQRTR